MLDLMETAKAFETGKELYLRAIQTFTDQDFQIEEAYGERSGCNAESDNRMGNGDNLTYMTYLLKQKDMAGKIQLIYTDPPFFSSGKYQASTYLETEKLGRSSMMKLGAYDDIWNGDMAAYLSMLTARLLAMKELLSDQGCIWVHLDWHSSHYVKIIMDQIFGEENFINEVIWTYKSGGSSKRSFAKKHDSLLFYAKTRQYKFNMLREKSYNRGYKPYRFKGIEEFRDETGWYTMVNMKDVWPIDMVGRTAGERTGYATQKPEKLLERVVASCSDTGDLCADFFSGSGTLGAVCEKMGRRWIMCDEGKLAAAGQIARLGQLGSAFVVERERPTAVDQTKGEHPDARTEESRLTIEVHDREIQLLEYHAAIPENMKKHEEELIRYMNDDSLCLLKCWSIDPQYDGKVHRARYAMPGKQRSCYIGEKKGQHVKIILALPDMTSWGIDFLR